MANILKSLLYTSTYYWVEVCVILVHGGGTESANSDLTDRFHTGNNLLEIFEGN